MKMSVGAAVSEGLTEAGGSTSKTAHSQGHWQEAAGPRHDMGLSTGLLVCLHTMAAGFPRISRPRERTSWDLL